MKVIFEGHVVGRYVKYNNEPNSDKFTRIAFHNPEYKNDVQCIIVAGDFKYGSKIEIAIEIEEIEESSSTTKVLTTKDL